MGPASGRVFQQNLANGLSRLLLQGEFAAILSKGLNVLFISNWSKKREDVVKDKRAQKSPDTNGQKGRMPLCIMGKLLKRGGNSEKKRGKKTQSIGQWNIRHKGFRIVKSDRGKDSHSNGAGTTNVLGSGAALEGRMTSNQKKNRSIWDNRS